MGWRVLSEELGAEQLRRALVRLTRRCQRLGRRRRRGCTPSHGGVRLPGHRPRLYVTIGRVNRAGEPLSRLILVLVHAGITAGALPAEELAAHLVLPARLAILLLLLPLSHAVLGPGSLLEDGLLVRPHDLHKLLDPSQIWLAVAAQVPSQVRQLLPVHRHDQVDRALPDLQRGRVRQEIVTHEEAHEDEIVKHALLVVPAPRQIDPVPAGGDRVQVHGEILAQHRDGQELIGLARDRGLVLGDLTEEPVAIGRHIRLWRVLLKDDLAEDPKVWLVRRERQHDEIRVEAVHDVLGVRVEALESPLLPDVVHGLVLALSGDGSVGHDHLDSPPRGIRVHPLVHVILKRGAEAAHEGRARRDDVAVERLGLLPRRDVDSLSPELLPEFLVLLLLLLGLLRGAKSTRSLLIHLGPRRDAVDGHVQQLPRADHGEEPVDVVEDALEHLFLGGWRRAILRVEARVDDAVHVEVQVIELLAVGVGPGAVHGHLHAVHVPRLVLDDILNDQRVLLAEPAVEGGNSHVDNNLKIRAAAKKCRTRLAVSHPARSGLPRKCGWSRARHVLNEYDRVDCVISFDAPRVCAPRFALSLARNRRLHFLGLGASNFFLPDRAVEVCRALDRSRSAQVIGTRPRWLRVSRLSSPAGNTTRWWCILWCFSRWWTTFVAWRRYARLPGVPI